MTRRKIILPTLLCLFSFVIRAQQQKEKDSNAITLQAVNVVATSKNAPLRQPLSVSVIDMKQFYTRSSNTADILNQSTGVRVRQDGGLGSRAEFLLNGFTGKQVKIFIDGIPADYLGAGAGLNVLSPSAIDRIEIYKGVIPAELSGDALGGAINVITRKDLPQYLDLTYEHSSFHTHKASLNTRYTGPRKWYAAISGSYNYSDNDYKIDVEIPNAAGNPEPATVRRFHDRFTSHWLHAETGMTGHFAVGVTHSGINKQLQHNIVMTQPYGKANFAENSITPYLRWSVKDFLPKTTMAVYVSHTYSASHFLDTSLNAYNWRGEVANRRHDGGELSGSRNDLRLYTNNTIGRLQTGWTPDSLQTISLQVFQNSYIRTGNDPVAEAFYGKNFYSYRTRSNKWITSIAYQRKIPAWQLSTVTTLKYFSFSSDGFTIVNNEAVSTKQRQHNTRFNQAIKWQPITALAVKASYEYASRLPDETELFGDFALVRSNPKLVPEVSHNLNAGMQVFYPRWSAAITGFLRYTDNIIYLRSSPFFAQYQNLLKAQTMGVEGEVKMKLLPVLQLSANSTYQQIINKTNQVNAGVTDDRYYNLRLPNIPYFFSNAELAFSKPIGKKQHRLHGWYNISHVHWFYLYWSVDGRPDLKATVPDQLVQNMGCTWTLSEDRLTLGGEIHNIADASNYDNFSVQKPGRSFHVKARLLIR